MHKKLKRSIICFGLAFVQIWLCFYLISISGIDRHSIMLLPAMLTTLITFIGLVISGAINLIEYCAE